MIKMKKVLSFLLIVSMTLTITLVSGPTSTLASPTEDKSINPYVQMYLNEKEAESTSNDKSKEFLVDPKVEEQIIISTLEEYYKEDKIVAKILKKYIKDSNIDKKTLGITKEGKIATMKVIQKVYYDIENENEQKILKAYLERYARGTKDESSISFLNELTPKFQSINNARNEYEKEGQVLENNLSTLSYLGEYDGLAAAKWAYDNYQNYSSDFPDFTNNGDWGSDCANYVSQAMHVGGTMPMQGDWYIYKKNSTYLRPENADQLDYSWDLADPSPWTSAKQFASFWTSRATTRYFFADYYRANHSTVYSQSIFKGDAVILYKGIAGFIIVPTHVMIISSYDTVNRDFKLAGHSVERQAHPLLTAIKDYAEVAFISF